MEGKKRRTPPRTAKWFLPPFLLTVKIDGRQTPSGEATQIPGRSLEADGGGDTLGKPPYSTEPVP